MKVFLLGSGPAWSWTRVFLDKVTASAARAVEIVILDEALPRDVLAEFHAEPLDVLIVARQASYVDENGPADTAAEAVRSEARKAILAIELARRTSRMLLLRPAEATEWPRLIIDLLELSTLDITLLNEPMPSEATVEDSGTAVPSSSSLLIQRTYLMPLFAAVANAASVVVTWPRDCFLYGDAPGEALPATIEVAGRARILAYGPYMPLPQGRWRATAYLGFSADIGSMPFMLESDTDSGITRGFFEVKQGGIFALELEFEVTDSFHPVEFRLVSQDSALEGLASLIEIRLEQSLPPEA
ncbi:MAG: hypothetical protein LCH93_10030 [Proteobacteria bacterium]|nr:hypothetical protein [Pseudomonadota bacterium]